MGGMASVTASMHIRSEWFVLMTVSVLRPPAVPCVPRVLLSSGCCATGSVHSKPGSGNGTTSRWVPSFGTFRSSYQGHCSCVTSVKVLQYESGSSCLYPHPPLCSSGIIASCALARCAICQCHSPPSFSLPSCSSFCQLQEARGPVQRAGDRERQAGREHQDFKQGQFTSTPLHLLLFMLGPIWLPHNQYCIRRSQTQLSAHGQRGFTMSKYWTSDVRLGFRMLWVGWYVCVWACAGERGAAPDDEEEGEGHEAADAEVPAEAGEDDGGAVVEQ